MLIQTYLTDPSTNPRYLIDLQDSHEELAATCMCYVSLCLSGSLISINDKPPFRITSSADVQHFGLPDYTGSPLLEYVLTKSFHHLLFLLPGNEVVLGDMLALESDLHQHPDEWEHLRRLAVHSLPWPSVKHDFVIYTLIAFAPNWLLGTFLDRESLFRRLERHHGSNPLIYTASFHTIDHARMLLSRGANLHSSGWLIDDSRQVLPLTAAVQTEGKSNKIVDLFLEWGSPIPPDLFTDIVSNPSGFTLPVIKRLLQTDEFVEWLEHRQDQPISLISFILLEPSLIDEQDLFDTLWRLVQVGLDPRAPDSSGTTVFHLASAGGYSSVVEYLLSIGVELPNNILFFVLDHGCSNNRIPSMIRYLLKHGADPHSQVPTGTGDTALHIAIKKSTTQLQSLSDSNTSNLEEIVTVLIGSGCDPTSRNIDNYTPLHLAIAGGHVSVVKYLLQVHVPLPEGLSEMVSLAPSSARDEIKDILINSGYPAASGHGAD